MKGSPTLERLWPYGVAPVRERGLKASYPHFLLDVKCRSRKGAWIEGHVMSPLIYKSGVAPVRERGLKADTLGSISLFLVAPVRERGLKTKNLLRCLRCLMSLP